MFALRAYDDEARHFGHGSLINWHQGFDAAIKAAAVRIAGGTDGLYITDTADRTVWADDVARIGLAGGLA
jgi:hypothetical protein